MGLVAVGLVTLAGCSANTKPTMTVASCGGAPSGSWTEAGQLTNTSSTARTFNVEGQLQAGDGTILDSGRQTLTDVAPNATVGWQVGGTVDPSLLSQGLQCRVGILQVPQSIIAGLIVAFVAWILLGFAALWSVFVKAGEKGWKALVPVYNGLVLARIADAPPAFGWLLSTPLNIVAYIFVGIGLARRFGKKASFGVALGIFPPIFNAILGFGPAKYDSPSRKFSGGGPSAGSWASPPSQPWAPPARAGSWTPPAPGGTYSYRPGGRPGSRH